MAGGKFTGKDDPRRNDIGPLPIPNDLKEARKLNKHSLELTLNKYIFMTYEDAARVLENKNKLPMLDMCIVSVIFSAAKEGDYKRMEFLFDRLVGPVLRTLKVQGEPLPQKEDVPVSMSTEERLEMIDKYRELVVKRMETIDVEADVSRQDKP